MNHNQNGLTFLEVMISIAILASFSVAILAAFDSFSSRIHSTQALKAQDQQLHSLMNTLRTNVDLYQLNYDHKVNNIEIGLDPDNLPMAWGANVVTKASKCPNCPGRLGYVVHPVTGLPGMFRVVVRVKHRSLFKGHRDYEFIVSPK